MSRSAPLSASLSLLVRVLRAPRAAAQLDLAGWDLLLRQAGNANLLVSLLYLLEDAGLLDAVPPAPRAHLEWARLAAASHARSVRHEVACIAAALSSLDVPLILLKGSAYAMAGLDAGRGRLFSDVDILVPKACLDQVEAALMLSGWASTHHDPYDQHYYREWMHEIPPMVHVRRGNTIDVHHAILPETAAVRPDPDLLRAAAVPIAQCPGLLTLAPHDMFLHSAVHLFSDGEFEHGLRDLLDLHRLALQFGAEPGFWNGLVPRAQDLQLGRPLYYALRYLQPILGTPVPIDVTEAAEAEAPNPAQRVLMDALFLSALQPHHPSCVGRLDAAARFALYLRGNWLRMPPLMLARHLSHKAFVSPRADATGDQA